jgi:hypothetical protein
VRHPENAHGDNDARAGRARHQQEGTAMKRPPAAAVVFQPAAALHLRAGMRQILQAVRPTLGPRPRLVAFAGELHQGKPELLDDGGLIARRIIQLASREADAGTKYVRQMLYFKSLTVGDTRWHSDGYGGRGGLRHIKLAFHLDPLTRATGALRVIPGCHRVGEPFADQVEREIRDSQTLWGVAGSDVPAVALETQPGDVVVFNHDLKHSAWGGSQRRRMFTMNCCQRYPDEKLQDLRDYIAGAAGFWIERAYDDTLVRSAGPERMVHLEQVLANDGHLAELNRKNREAAAEPARG